MDTPRLDQPPETLRARVLAYFEDSWETYERLFAVLTSDRAFYQRADPLRHPLVFYVGHTATFFVNKLVLARILPAQVDPHLESLFAIGVDEMSWDDLDATHYDWPAIADVFAYRRKVKELVQRAIETLPLSGPVTWDHPFWAVVMGIEHERIHLETSSVLIRQLPLDLVRPHPAWPLCGERGAAPDNTLLAVPGGAVALGKDREAPLYGWDNEYPRHEERVPAFEAARYLTSNAELRGFVDAGGYRERAWWSEEGWAWRCYAEAEHPRFWVRGAGDGAWRLRCLTEEIPMPWSWPAEVNQLEAKAFCAWKAAELGRSLRLPTEAEWYRLLDVAGLPERDVFSGESGNIALARQASSCPVDRHVHGGFGDVVGNVWQWTETPIDGFPGFAVHPLYDDFSTPTFDGRHNLMKGGSWISTGNEATRAARYAFRRHFYQHAGFRVIASEQEVSVPESVYESDEAVAQYCDFHYGPEQLGVPNFPRRCAELCREVAGERPLRRVLDLGCATGRATFELARFAEHVTGVDFSARFIKVAHELKQHGTVRYVVAGEGELTRAQSVSLDALGLADVADRVELWQGDAHNLKPRFSGYDLVLAANLIDRLHDPAHFLAHIGERIVPGGLLVLLSPYTWLEAFTPKANWLGGRVVDGREVTTLEGLEAALSGHFRRVGAPRDVPFVIRETPRKHQHTLSEMTVWERL
ncbi:MAG: SAM-dependent methyltransferase [Deltaproteobacteria bacterium HGW-Deltaproteobacteria-14]|nr:MAG: SAM-dependent methyltransferase [Deltaproteobacteria bacterium HGW-Deltaproteobacteria-14]